MTNTDTMTWTQWNDARNTQPSFAARCPADGIAIPDDMGCTCAEVCE